MANSPTATHGMAVELSAPRLSSKRCRDLLSEAREGYLALSRGALPVVVPVTCALGSDSLLLRAGPGSLDGFASQPGVVAFGTSIPSVDGTCRFEVLVQGRAELVRDPATGSPPRFPLVDNSLTIVFQVTLELVTGWQFGPAA
jgi:hypothetical protein